MSGNVMRGTPRRLASGVRRAVRGRTIIPPSSLVSVIANRPGKPFALRYANLKLWCRPEDWLSAVEVLLDDEYAPVMELLDGVPAPIVYDGGANIGAFGLRVLASAPGARVVSVEPDPGTYAELARTAAAHAGWTPVAGALWDREESLAIAPGVASTGNRVTPADAGGGVGAVTLHGLMEQLGHDHVDVLKLDIEGAEERVLLGDPELLERVGAVIVEIHPDACDERRIVELLERRYARCDRLVRESAKPVLLASDR